MRRLHEENYKRRSRDGEAQQPEALGGRVRLATKSEAIKYVREVQEEFKDQREIYEEFIAILNDYRKSAIGLDDVVAALKELFKGHKQLIYGFGAFVGSDITADEVEPVEEKKPVEYADGIDFIVKLQKRCQKEGQEQIYKGFQNILRMYCHGQKDIRELYAEVSGLLEDHLDLLKWFMRFLPNRLFSEYENTLQHGSDVDGTEDYIHLKSKYRKEFIFCANIKQKMNHNGYQLFLKGLKFYSRGGVSRRDIQSFVADLLGRYPDLTDGFTEFIDCCENIDVFVTALLNEESILSDEPLPQDLQANETGNGSMYKIDPPIEKSNEECSSKPIQELGLSNCKLCLPSYRLLPSDVPIRMSRIRTDIAKRVFNDHWVTVTSLIEDFSFKHVCRNHYEESLFKCEEDRYDLDTWLESLNSTAKKVKDLLTSLTGSANEGGPILLEEHFTPCNLRCIERLYGDHGLEAINNLRRIPAVCLPTILFFLEQKQEEWAKCQVDYNKHWDEIYSKNHSKSLDHRGFYFKQQDSRNMSIKYLVAEIKEIKENRQKEEGLLLVVANIATGINRPLIPHLKFEYFDNDIHDDVLKLTKFACVKICSTEEHQNKVMMLCTTFLEPMLRFTSRAQQRLAKDGSSSSPQPKSPSDVDMENNNHDDTSEGSEEYSDTDNEYSDTDNEYTDTDNEYSDTDDDGKNASEEGDELEGEAEEAERMLSSGKPSEKYVSSTSGDADKNDSQMFYGNDTFYAVFRLYRMLYERLLTAKTNSTCSKSESSNSKGECHVDPYARFMKALYVLLDGSTDNAKFEDDCHSIIGNQSYVLFTLDKLVYKLVKQLEVAATAEIGNKLLELYEFEGSREKFIDSVYYEKSRALLPEDMYRFEISSSPDRMSIQLMNNANEKPEMISVSTDPYFAPYGSLDSNSKEPEGSVLQRNKSKYDDYTAATKAMEDVGLSNGLECEAGCSSSKIYYVTDTEDVFFRAKRARKNSSADFSRP